MKCRRMVDKNIIWFGSAGRDSLGKKIAENNYSYEKEAVAQSLRQKLSIIKGELWFNTNLGIPLLDTNKKDVVLDSYISSILMSQPDVISIKKFVSKQINHKYTCSFIVQTIYGDYELTI